MSVMRIFQSAVAILLMVGLIMAAGFVFAVTVLVLIGLGVIHWLRSKGILADKEGKFRRYDEENTSPSQTQSERVGDVIEGEYQKLDEN